MVRALLFILCLALMPNAALAQGLAGYKQQGEKAFETDTDASVAAYEKARTLAPNDPDVLHQLVTLYIRQDRLEAAESLGRTLAASPNSDARARGLLDLGNIADASGDFNGAKARHSEALKLATSANLPQREAEALGNLASIEIALSRFDEAEALLNRALPLDEKNGDRKGQADDLGNLGYIALERGKLDEATRFFNRALALDKQIGRLEGQAYGYNALGLVAWEKDDRATAVPEPLQAVEITRSMGAEKSYIGIRAREDLKRCPPVA